MIHFDLTRCIGCGLCVRDCFPGALAMEDGRPNMQAPESCIECGHCVAICPGNVVSADDMTEPRPAGHAVDSDALLQLMRSRRSCRHFKSKPVPPELLRTLVEAAVACPTAKNLQATRYIAVTKSVPALLDAALETLGQLGEQMIAAGDGGDLRRAGNFLRWRQQHREDPSFDPLFFHAPLLLMLVAEADTARDAAAGAAYAELMAACLGLGCLYSGYFAACAAASREIQRMLGLSPTEQVVRCLVLGYPVLTYPRTAPRRPPQITSL